jgi:hypothetical protein
MSFVTTKNMFLEKYFSPNWVLHPLTLILEMAAEDFCNAKPSFWVNRVEQRI